MQEVQASSPKHRFDLSTRQWLGVILVLHLLVGLIYSIAIPAWEAHDEWAHYRYAAYVAENFRLPPQDQNLNKVFPDDEASQPPLYYVLAAVPMIPVDTQDGYQPQVNPYISGSTALAGLNLVIHQPDVERFPWHGSILALHLGRFVSILISLLALFVTFKIIRYLVPHRPGIALVGTAIQAFAPQFLFLGAVMTNDILAIATGSLLLYFMLRLIIEGPTLKWVLATSAAAGLALLTKYVAVAIIPLVAVAFVWGAWRHRRDESILRQLAISFVAVIVPALLLSGGLLWRNHSQTGRWIPRDIVPQEAVLSGLQGSETSLNLHLVLPALKYGFLTYWASFGWGNLSPGTWYYLIWLGIILVGLVGLLLWLRTPSAGRSRKLAPFLLLFVLFAVGIPLFRELTYDRPFLRGRLLLSTLPVAVWTIAVGWAYLSKRFWRWVRWGLVAWPAGVSLYLLFFLIMPAYKPPPALAAPPALPIPVNVRFGETVQLLSADIQPADTVKAGSGLFVTLAWRVIVPTDDPYALTIQLLGAADEVYGSVVSFPGYGNAATNVWEPGKVFEETYWFTVGSGGPLPASGTIRVALYNKKANPSQLPVYDSRGDPIGDHVTFGSIRIDPPGERPAPELTKPTMVTFGSILALKDARFPAEPQSAGSALPVWLAWQALAAGPDDLTLSVQLLDADNHTVVGNDGPVSDILLPHHWQPGDVLNSVRWLSLPDEVPAGNYRLVAILYRHGDLTRLQAVDADGQPVPENIFTLGEVIIR